MSISRKRFTVIASQEGVDKAERALVRLGFESKANFGKSQLIARSAVTNFFQRVPIQPDTFKRICDGLQLNWEEIWEPKYTRVSKQSSVGQPVSFEKSESAAN